MKIGELATQGAVTAKTIRFYEDAGLLPPPARTLSGYRDYATETIDRLAFIRQSQAAGLSLQQIKQILAITDRGDAPCTHVRQLLSTRLDGVRAQIAELITLETRLDALLTHAEQDHPTEHDESTVCWILESTAEATIPTADKAV